ncbi:MAG: BrxA/BrxB family bacilliredoxin [Acidobacteria bacterium]|nr:BrxA/BrxB family bacilliredoxin [Acidobacteriota bacterium]
MTSLDSECSFLLVSFRCYEIFPNPNLEIIAGGKLVAYSELLIKPMREDLTELGIEETRSPEEVDAAIQGATGTVMVVVNSVCGCAAGKARPGVGLALQNKVTPEKVITVFAGADIDATERARGYFKGYPPSSPCIALLQNGRVVYMMERYQIEGRDAHEIGAELSRAFDRFCDKSAQPAATGD